MFEECLKNVFPDSLLFYLYAGEGGRCGRHGEWGLDNYSLKGVCSVFVEKFYCGSMYIYWFSIKP